MGRPTRCTPERTAAVADNLRAGLRIVTAATLADVGERTHHRWIDRGRSAITGLDNHLDDLPPNERDHLEQQLVEWDETPPADRGPHPALELVPENERPYVQYWQQTMRALAEYERGAVIRIQRSALPQTVEEVTEKYDADGGRLERTVKTREVPGDWRADMELLGRRFARDWGRVNRIEGGEVPVRVESEVGGTVRHEHEHRLSADDATAAAAVLADQGLLDQVIAARRLELSVESDAIPDADLVEPHANGDDT